MVIAAIGGSELEAAEAVPVAVKASSQFEARFDNTFTKTQNEASQTGLLDAEISVASPDEDEALESVGSGVASFYGRAFAGRRTASGDVFDPAQLTAAHRTLPFGSRVKVTNERNGRTVVVRINDRGPFHGNRVIDLSRAAADQIGIVGPGSGRVELALLTN